MQKLTVKNSRFVDQHGRHVLLHGISLVNKNPKTGYFFDVGLKLFGLMRDWGFNVIRLGVIWDGLEPEPDGCVTSVSLSSSLLKISNMFSNKIKRLLSQSVI